MKHFALISLLAVALTASPSRAQIISVSPVPKQLDLSGRSSNFRGAQVVVDESIDVSGLRIAIKKLEDIIGRGSGAALIMVSEHQLQRPQEYRIIVRHHTSRPLIRITGSNESLVHALTTLQHLFESTNGQIPEGYVRDWPDHRLRVAQLALKSPGDPSRPPTIGEAFRMVDRIREAQFNSLLLGPLSPAILEDAGAQRIWSPDNLARLAEYARGSGLEVIPLLNLKPQGFVSRSRLDVVYDEGGSLSRDIGRMLDRTVEVMGATRVHVGLDEIRDQGALTISPEHFLAHTRMLNRLTQERDLEMWMWADMLLDPSRFSGSRVNVLDMNGGLSVNGVSYSSILDDIPSRVVLVDWRYWGNQRQPDYPELDALVREHRVLGATWFDVYGSPGTPRGLTTIAHRRIAPFSFYAYRRRHAGRGVLGMVATTWPGALGGHIQGNRWLRDHRFSLYADVPLDRARWQLVESIYHTSGQAFWNAEFNYE